MKGKGKPSLLPWTQLITMSGFTEQIAFGDEHRIARPAPVIPPHEQR
jgi:hypothetical protein